MIDKVKSFFYKSQSISGKKISDNLKQFIDSKNIVYRGVSSDEVAEHYIKLLSDAGEKGDYFRKKEQSPGILEKRKNLVYYDGKLDSNEIKSHTTSGSKNTQYVSTTSDFEVAKEFALNKKTDEKNAYIILAFTEKTDLNKDLKNTSLTDYLNEKEIIFYHAIFPDRIVGIFSQDETGGFTLFHINPDLYSVLQKGAPLKIPTEQINFDSSSQRLGNELHTIRYD